MSSSFLIFPVSKFYEVEGESEDTRKCRKCGGLKKEHGIYWTSHHVPDLDKPLRGFNVTTAECPYFDP
jgi:hypothetical protein